MFLLTLALDALRACPVVRRSGGRPSAASVPGGSVRGDPGRSEEEPPWRGPYTRGGRDCAAGAAGSGAGSARGVGWAAKEGLLALSVGVGLGVLQLLMEEEVDEVVGPKHARDPERAAVHHGHEAGQVTLGGRCVGVQRPRVRATDGSGELPLSTYQHFADRDPLARVVLEQMLAGVSARRFSRTREPVGGEVLARERSASESAVSREFVHRTRQQLSQLMSRSLQDTRLATLMVDGIELKGRCCVVALGITTDGVKVPLGLWDGSTENKIVTAHLLAALIARGLEVEQGVLVVLDGSEALRAAVNDVFGPVPVQRCIRHKERNVLDHLPERDRPAVKTRL